MAPSNSPSARIGKSTGPFGPAGFPEAGTALRSQISANGLPWSSLIRTPLELRTSLIGSASKDGGPSVRLEAWNEPSCAWAAIGTSTKARISERRWERLWLSIIEVGRGWRVGAPILAG